MGRIIRRMSRKRKALAYAYLYALIGLAIPFAWIGHWGAIVTLLLAVAWRWCIGQPEFQVRDD